MPRVNAQQARRILDRLVGYKISPLLWAKVRGGLSAGRVQSVAVRLIVDREREIRAFVAREYWTITRPARSRPEPPAIVFPADLYPDRRREGGDRERRAGRRDRRRRCEAPHSACQSVKTRETRRNPAAAVHDLDPPAGGVAQAEVPRPQDDAARPSAVRRRRSRRHEGTQGLITYMRTDSTRIADSAPRRGARLHHRPVRRRVSRRRTRSTGSREGAQDAHEAIRPTVGRRGRRNRWRAILKRDELRLYQLIWERFVASQMASAIFDQTTVDIRRHATASRSARPAAC